MLLYVGHFELLGYCQRWLDSLLYYHPHNGVALVGEDPGQVGESVDVNLRGTLIPLGQFGLSQQLPSWLVSAIVCGLKCQQRLLTRHFVELF